MALASAMSATGCQLPYPERYEKAVAAVQALGMEGARSIPSRRASPTHMFSRNTHA
jgi:hypothetical protein